MENKSVQAMLPIHEAQLLTYLKLSGHRVGLLLNWNVPLMEDGIRRRVNRFSDAQPALHLDSFFFFASFAPSR